MVNVRRRHSLQYSIPDRPCCRFFRLFIFYYLRHYSHLLLIYQITRVYHSCALGGPHSCTHPTQIPRHSFSWDLLYCKFESENFLFLSTTVVIFIVQDSSSLSYNLPSLLTHTVSIVVSCAAIRCFPGQTVRTPHRPSYFNGY